MHSRLFGFTPVAMHAAGCSPRILSLRLIFADHRFAACCAGVSQLSLSRKLKDSIMLVRPQAPWKWSRKQLLNLSTQGGNRDGCTRLRGTGGSRTGVEYGARPVGHPQAAKRRDRRDRDDV